MKPPTNTKTTTEIVVYVLERRSDTRTIVGHDLSGPYRICISDDLSELDAAAEAIEICREQLPVDGDIDSLYLFSTDTPMSCQ